MNPRIFGLIGRSFLGLALATLLNACSKPDGSRILGHWRADRMSLQGLSVPIGPELLISRSLLRSPDGAIEIPISMIKEAGDVVTLDIPLGLGLAFQFESRDRMSFEVPLVGHKIYYQRVVDAASAPVSQTAGPQPVPVAQRPTGEPPSRESTAAVVGMNQNPAKASIPSVQTLAQPVLTGQAQVVDPMSYYHQSILHMRQGDPDAAVRSLRDAFEHGFRDFKRLDASQDLAPLKTDPRYNALVARYQ
jgi:hypothetical protein